MPQLRTVDDEEKVRDLGANEVIDYTKADFAELLSGYDVVLDSLGGDNLAKSLTVLRPGGLAISVVGPPDAAFAEQVGRPILKPVMVLMSRKVPGTGQEAGCALLVLLHASRWRAAEGAGRSL